MKINYYRQETIEENRVDVFFRKKDKEIEGIMEYLDAYDVITGRSEDVIRRIYPSEIYYCEIVERRCYAYLKQEVLQIDFSLRELTERYGRNGFVQIGKSALVNVYKIRKIKTDLNMKLQLFLKNDEVLILNRTYKKEFMEYLKRLQEAHDENN